MSCHSAEGRGVESTVVVHPSADHRVKHPREVVNRFVALQLQPPTTHLLAQRFRGGRGDGRCEVGEESAIPIVTTSGAERITQKVELDVLVLLLPMNILAVDDMRLIGMKLQTAFFQPLRQCCFYILGLLETAAVDQCVIGVPTEGQSRVLSRHPAIEGVVQVQIRQ